MIASGIDYLLKRDFKAASRIFNMALLEDPTNANLHYFNGYTYHMMAEIGDSTNYDLAAMGYMKAIDLDHSNWMASLQLGRIKLREKKYMQAQELFANVLLYKSDQFEAIYGLATASYYIQDVNHAAKYINQAAHLRPNDPTVQRSAAVVMAAAGRQDLAKEHLDNFSKLKPNSEDFKQVNQRVLDWEKIHNSSNIHLAQADEIAEEEEDEEEASGADAYDNMVILEGVVLLLRNVGNTTKGENILKVLRTAIDWGHRYAKNEEVHKRTFYFLDFNTESLATKVEYPMNIANVTQDYVDLIGRPTLVVEAGKEEAEFFSGSDLKISLTGEDGGTIETIEFGTTLKISLTSLEGDVATMEAFVESSDLLATTESGRIFIKDTGLEVAKNNVRTSLKAKIGETIMLGGFRQRFDSHNRSGVPLLGDIPILQYIFAEENTNSKRLSVLFMLTVRRYEPAMKQAKQRFKEQNSKPSPHLVELDARNDNMTDVEPFISIVIKAFDYLFREFRRGDIIPLRYNFDDFRDELRATVRFLWF